jgi:TonB family protein
VFVASKIKKLKRRNKMKRVTIILLLACVAVLAQEKDSLTDSRDGKTYKIVTIGKQTWMAENLNFEAKGSKCYDNKPANCKKYGRLYDMETAAAKACPAGWHLPSNEEWDVLYRFADGTRGKKTPSHLSGYKSETAGKYLKAASGWNSNKGKSGNGEDTHGFAALPGGSGFSGKFYNVGNHGYWWSDSLMLTQIYSCHRTMTYDGESANWDCPPERGYLLSIRCLKGETAETEKETVDYNSDTKNENYTERRSGYADMLGGLMGGSAGGLETKAKGSLKAPSARDIDMGSGDGSRSKAEIMAVINAHMPDIRNIYNKYLKLKPGFSGRVTLKFTIAPSGDIVSINIVSSTTDYDEFDNAVKNMVETWKWKVIKSGNTMPKVPFDFTE